MTIITSDLYAVRISMMDVSDENMLAAMGQPSTDLKYYSKRNFSVGTIAETPSSPPRRQIVQIPTNYTAYPSHSTIFDTFELGGFYEIDHAQLPPTFPAHLKDVRVVKVTERNGLNITVSFPSSISLSKFFEEKADYPDLDEHFVFDFDHAPKILRRMISFAEFEREGQLGRFWVSDSTLLNEEEEEERGVVTESCLVILKRSGAIGWGVQRKIRYFGRHRVDNSSQAVSLVKGETGKRTRELPGKKTVKKEKSFKKSKLDRGRACKGSSDRWSSERYLAAELKLLEIMKEKGAALGSPILRPELREAARKHIGDTGLLDHLLKHMAGKVVGEGKERFRRRHNPEGAMEYWLEPAELQDLRRSSGVSDPFWMPPPGWKPGDLISPCGLVCTKEIDLLKDQLSSLRREVDWLRSASLEEKDARERGDAASAVKIQESCKSLMKSNGKLEEQITAMARQLQFVQEELQRVKSEEGRREREGEKMGRRSGFRICKPEGTFLWPSVGGEGTTNSSTTGGEEPAAVPATPHSACSATSPPSVPDLSAASAVHRAKVVVVAHREGETTGCSDLLCSPVVGKGSSATGVWESGVWGRSISTELALSSPCYHR
ncbi:protein AMEIOTIC 1 homolog [Wolffia australiana]